MQVSSNTTLHGKEREKEVARLRKQIRERNGHSDDESSQLELEAENQGKQRQLEQMERELLALHEL